VGAEAGVDFVIAETFSHAEEALIALDVIKQTGLPAVVTMALHREPVTRDGFTPAEACKRLEAAGADVVGLNCIRGPRTMLPHLEAIRAAVSCHVAALPVPYRTHDDEPTFQSLHDPEFDGLPFPTGLDPFMCTRYDIASFGETALGLGIRYLGVCCGAGPHHIRSLAESVGRTPPASRYTADMSKHAYLGTDARPAQGEPGVRRAALAALRLGERPVMAPRVGSTSAGSCIAGGAAHGFSLPHRSPAPLAARAGLCPAGGQGRLVSERAEGGVRGGTLGSPR